MNEDMKKAPLWKFDKDLGIALFCPVCKRFVCSEKCECGTKIDFNLPRTKFPYKGKTIG